jgi:hypothetical protein
MEENKNLEEQKPVEQVQPVLPAPVPEVSLPARKKKHHPVVVIERDWKEYLGECLLIVFSVALAIGITEYLTSLHEKNEANEILHQLKEELISNKKDVEDQYAYHQQVFKYIDSAKTNTDFAKKFLDSGKIHFGVIFTQGVLVHDLKDVAWQEAKQADIFSKIDFETYSLLNDVYTNQGKILNLEPSMEKILISFESRKQENLQTTLTLIHDAIYGWSTQRSPWLINNYQKAIDKLAKY